ncbi:hypothetical protein D3C75_1040600 [compost metagenome]
MLGRLGILFFDHGIAAEHPGIRIYGERLIDLNFLFLVFLLAFAFGWLLILLLIAVDDLPAQTQ